MSTVKGSQIVTSVGVTPAFTVTVVLKLYEESPQTDQLVPKWSKAVTFDWIWTSGAKLDFFPPVKVKVVRC